MVNPSPTWPRSDLVVKLGPLGGYIVGFIFFMGVAGGSLILASLPILFNLGSMTEISKVAALIALVALIAGALYIFVDLGKPARVWRMVRYPNFRSPMIWDLILTVVHFIVSSVFLVALLADILEGVLKAIAAVALIAGIADDITAFVFSTAIARNYWYSAVQPVVFVAAAIASAGSVLILVIEGMTASGREMPSQGIGPVAVIASVGLILGLLLLASELVSMSFNKSSGAKVMLQSIWGSKIFWREIMTGILAAAILIITSAHSSKVWLTIGALLAPTHLVLKRIHFVHMGFSVPNVDYAGVNIDSDRGEA